MPPKVDQKNDFIRVRHMVDAIQEALSFVKGKTRMALERDRMLALSLIKEIEIIGEAASKISGAFQKTYPHIAWAEIVEIRNRLIHGYFDVDLNILWNTVIKDLPPLVKDLKRILKTK